MLKKLLIGSLIGLIFSIANGRTETVSIEKHKEIELQAMIDPYTGLYKKKVTIPKNFKGFLYLNGLNLKKLRSKDIRVRFNLGVDNQAVTVSARLAHASGSENVKVLAVDLSQHPFDNIRLSYDLYDYTDYSNNSSDDPVTDNLDQGLYCRGVNLSDDPTFKASVEKTTCSSSTDVCLYTYAKIKDATYYNISNNSAETPTKPQVWMNSTSWDSKLTYGMCSPDYQANSLFTDPSYIPSGYIYTGPYRPLNQSSWGISSDAMFAKSATDPQIFYGLFEVGNSSDRSTWYRSLLFPRTLRLMLIPGVNYLGSDSLFGVRAQEISDSSIATKYMDGCNSRVITYDPSTDEHIGSCSVSGSIEVLYYKRGLEVIAASSKSIKLQLVRASL